MTRHLLAAAITFAVSLPAAAIDDAQLRSLLESRLHGDRTGACVAAAVIDDGVARAIACADPKAPRPIGFDTAFEIGSVSKTMTATLLAQLIEQDRLALDDTLAERLPDGQSVPSFDGQPITLRHLLTHTSGLPSFPPAWHGVDPANPYASIDTPKLLATLDEVTLSRAPGSRFEYSNFGAMLLSTVVARTAGLPFETLIDTRLFEPLGMRASFVSTAPEGVPRAAGHLPTGQPTSPWDFAGDAAGVGGVRASLDDMVRYVQAQLGEIESPLSTAITATHGTIAPDAGRRMGMGWMIAPLNGRDVLVHEGGTGGFSSFVAFTADRSRGVVVLADTALTSLGGLGSIGLHLLDEKVPLGKPRIAQPAPTALLDRLAGRYRLQNGMTMELRRRGDALEIQASGQPAFAMGHDSAGDFYPLAFDAVLRPQVPEDGAASFVWLQGGGAVPAQRIDESAAAASPAPTVDPALLAGYAGTYELMPGFALRVFVEQGVLMAQATGQGAFALDPAGDDAFRADAFGIAITFERSTANEVVALALKQGGQTLRGARTP